MSIRRCMLASMALAGGWMSGSIGSGCSSCPDEDPIPIEDGTYRESPGASMDPGVMLREVVVTVEGEALTIQYVDDADGRVYVVRLEERM